MLVGRLRRALPGQRLQVSSFPVNEVEHQEPTEDQLVPVAETRT
jgi:hypothetical protein